MNKIFGFTIFVLIFNNYKAFADATPFKNVCHIDIAYRTSKTFDSCGIIYRNIETQSLDTFFNCKGYECVYVPDVNHIRLIRFVPDSFKVLFYFKDKILTSPMLIKESNSYHRLLISDTDIKEITPIFKVPYLDYFIALTTTIILELLVVLVYFKRHKIDLSNLRFIIYCNLLTHPILWLISANIIGFSYGNLIGEPIVLIFEALYIRQFIRPNLTTRKSLWLSFQMNIVSFLLGGLVYLLATS